MRRRLGDHSYNFLEILNLEENRVRRRAAAADACFNYHNLMPDNSLLAATMSILAASCWLFIDTRASRDRWQQAATLYADLHHPYTHILHVCAGQSGGIDSASDPDDPLDFICRLLRLAWLSVTVPQQVDSCRTVINSYRPLVERFRSQSTGQLNLPVRYVYDFTATLIDEWPERGLTPKVAAKATSMFIRAGDTVREAQADQYHWQNIIPGFMPVEPEWLAMGRIAYEVVRRGSEDSATFTEDLTELDILPILIAANMPPPTFGPLTSPPKRPTPSEGSGQASSSREGRFNDIRSRN